ncbi:MAG: LLM class flavin-dependent oxidoreductase [Acidimicrobiales bacterium]|nr:LLM class flavin-dependent oxidoreductase [Acidimicrobiales bacterium]
MSFSLFLPQMRMTHDAITERALAAEAAGFEGMAFMDHMAPPLAFEQPMWDAITTATWVLAKTTTLQAGHLVLCDSFRHPAVLARETLSLDHASGGRFELGIGWGSVPTEFPIFGIGSDKPRDRVRRLAETLDICKALWSGEVVDYEGEFFTLKGAQIAPRPTRHIPITIGGVGPKTLEQVRKHADWWNLPIHEVHRIGELREQAGDAKVSIQTMIALVPDESARDEVTATATKRFGAMGMRPTIGTANELADHFAALRDKGVERFYCWFADFATPKTLAGFAEVISNSSLAG